MLIRFIDGPRKGEVCHVMPHTAKHLCSVGTAVDAQNAAEVQEVSTEVAPPPAPTPPAQKQKKAKARKRRARASGKR